MTDFDALARRARTVVEAAIAARLMIATAESCTGGLVSAAVTAVPGSSATLDRAFVTYSNEAKTEMLGVDAELIRRHGAVSAEVAAAMVDGALARSRADVAVAITGIAGPGGGSLEKPVGLVWFAARRRAGPQILLARRYGDLGRDAVRDAATAEALDLLERLIAAPRA